MRRYNIHIYGYYSGKLIIRVGMEKVLIPAPEKWILRRDLVSGVLNNIVELPRLGGVPYINEQYHALSEIK